MDTVHDLGGREGFGPLRWRADDDGTLFHEPWQARTWAICMMMMARLREDEIGWTLEWHRHVLERIAPADYLSMNYFEKWVQAMMAVAVDAGLAETDEFIAGHSRALPPPQDRAPLAASVEPGPPRFAVGDAVVAKRSVSSMHTRLPLYARGRKGVIAIYAGPTIFADAGALGDIRQETLYTVRFEAAELWPEAGGQRVAVHLDLWESYLDPA